LKQAESVIFSTFICVSIPKRVSEALKPCVTFAAEPRFKVSIPKRVSEALKQDALNR